jgi:lipopolysaccharide biosynthesis glycosyltransferase
MWPCYTERTEFVQGAGLLGTGQTVAVAFCSDDLMEVPLHVAASALLRHLAAGVEPRFYMLLTGFSGSMQESLRRTLDSVGRPYRITFLSSDLTRSFAGFRPLLGNYAPYYRLLLADLIEEPVFLYIDSDTLPGIDVSPLFRCEMGQFPAGFVVDGKVRMTLEHRLFESLGRDPEGPAFNSGVMLVQREQWIAQGCWPRLRQFCEQYSDQLLTADQTALNAILAEECYHLPPEYNVKLYPGRKPGLDDEPSLYHFLGAPKPWDFMGRTLLPCSGKWFDELKRIPLPATKKLLWLNGAYWKRAPRMLGGYRRLLKAALGR